MAKYPTPTEIKDNDTTARVYMMHGNMEVYADVCKTTGKIIDCTFNANSMQFGGVCTVAHREVKKHFGNIFDW